MTNDDKLNTILEQLEMIRESQDEQQRQLELIRDRLESLDTFEDLPIDDYNDIPF